MAKPFLVRLSDYYRDLGRILSSEASAAAIFANSSDIGITREHAYFGFLSKHLPQKCSIFLGGFLFDDAGEESNQLDIIITTDTAPRFELGGGKGFSPVEGSLGVVSVKSTLDKKQLFDSLTGMASIPATRPLLKRANPMLVLTGYDDWPLKVVYANAGLNCSTILQHLDDFYTENANIPLSRRPNVIHVAGKYFIYRAIDSHEMQDSHGKITSLQLGKYYCFESSPDLQAITYVVGQLQQLATKSTHIIFSYDQLFAAVARESMQPQVMG